MKIDENNLLGKLSKSFGADVEMRISSSNVDKSQQMINESAQPSAKPFKKPGAKFSKATGVEKNDVRISINRAPKPKTSPKKPVMIKALQETYEPQVVVEKIDMKKTIAKTLPKLPVRTQPLNENSARATAKKTNVPLRTFDIDFSKKIMEEFSHIIDEEKERRKEKVEAKKRAEQQRLHEEELRREQEIVRFSELSKTVIPQIMLNKAIDGEAHHLRHPIFNLDEAAPIAKQPDVVTRPAALAKAITTMKNSTPGQKSADSVISPAVQKEIDAVRRATAEFKQAAQKMIALSSPGSGEVNLRFLDDVDTTNLTDGATLVWNAAKKKFVFGNAAIITTNSMFMASSYPGDGVTLNYTLPMTVTANATFVYINGVLQLPGSAYNVTGTTLTLTSPVAIIDTLTIKTPSLTLTAGDTFTYNDEQVTGTGASVYNIPTINGRTANDIIVSINGIVQEPGNAYGVTAPSTITFAGTISAPDIIDVRVPVLTSTTNTFYMDSNQFVGTGTQSVYTLTTTTTSNDVFVHINGVDQIPGTAFTISGTTLTFVSPIGLNDIIDVRIPRLI